MSIDNIGDMKECGHAEYRRIYDKYEEKLTVFSSYSGGILGMPQMSTAWGIRGMETALIASECEDWEHRREDPDAWTYWENADLVAALDRASSAESSLAAMRQRAEEAEATVAEAVECSRAQAKNFFEMKWRAERAEACLRRIQRLADDSVNGPVGPHTVLRHIANVVDAALPSPPADASTMGGERERRLARLAGILSTREKPIGCARCGWIGLEKELKAGVSLGWFCPSCGSHEITEDIATLAISALSDHELAPTCACGSLKVRDNRDQWVCVECQGETRAALADMEQKS